jgi:HlyD family secretion protein
VALALQDGAAAQVQANTESGTEVNQAQAQLETARAAVLAAQARLGQTVLRAPSEALVLVRNAEVGQIVQPGKALVSLAVAGPTQIKAQVDELFLSQLAVGQPATVIADAFSDQRLTAKVSFISPAVDAQRGAVEVTLTLDKEAPGFLREDMTLSIEVETARKENALTVPLAALRTNAAMADDTAQVLIAVDGRAQLREIRLGVRSLQAAEVVSGLQTGDTVLLLSSVTAGQRVHPREVTEPVAASPTPNAQAGAAGAAMTNAMGR